MRMDGRAVECNGLENRRGFASSVSSNLTPSAIKYSSGFKAVFFVPKFLDTTFLYKIPLLHTIKVSQASSASWSVTPYILKT